MKLNPTWQGIPFEVKEAIVQNLDFKSRFRLRVCSKSDLYLIDNCPFFLEQIEIHDSSLHIKDQYGYTRVKENTFDHFLKIFKQSRTTIKSVILSLDGAQGAELCQVLAKTKIFRIRAKTVYFDFNGVSDQDYLKIFDIFNAKTLSFRQTLSQNLLEELLKTETWKSAKQIFCYGRQDFPMDAVKNLEKFRCYVDSLSSEDAQNIISSFAIRKNLMPGFGFRVNYSSGQVDLKVSSKLDKSYHFPTNTSGFTFVVNLRKSAFGNQIIEGYACSDTNDFKKFSIWTSEDHLQVNRRLMDQLPFLPPWGMFIRSMLLATDH